MFARTPWLYVRFLASVQAKPSTAADDVVDSVLDIDSNFWNTPAERRYLAQREANASMSDRHNLIQLRIGGAKMLTPTAANINNNDAAHPLFFSKTTPRGAGLCLPMVQALKKLKIYRLTELQGALVPLLLRGRHVMAHAETGTGKSFGIALAIANRIARDNINYRLHTIILVPTDELALQYDKWLKHFGGAASQVVQPAIESIPLEAQLAKIHNVQPHVLVGTPQRVADVTRLAPTVLSTKLRKMVDCIVLDEADLILNADITYGRSQLKGKDLVDRLYRDTQQEVAAQIVATSATIDGTTAKVLNTWMRNDTAVRITTSFVEHTIPSTIHFYFFATHRDGYTPEDCLMNVLKLIFKHHRKPRILVFTGGDPESMVMQYNNNNNAMEDTMVEHVTDLINRRAQELVLESPGWGPTLRRLYERDHDGAVGDSIKEGNSGKNKPTAPPSREGVSSNRVYEVAATLQDKCGDQVGGYFSPKKIVGRNREIFIKNDSNISRINEGRIPIGVGHYDVSRGLHISKVTHVVMYCVATPIPTTSEFVHCAGRTGRMGKKGEVFTIFSPKGGKAIRTLCDAVEIPMQIGRMSAVTELLKIPIDLTPVSVKKARQKEAEDEEARQRLSSVLLGDAMDEEENAAALEGEDGEEKKEEQERVQHALERGRDLLESQRRDNRMTYLKEEDPEAFARQNDILDSVLFPSASFPPKSSF